MSAVHLPRLLGPDQAQSVLISRSAVHHASRYDPFGYRGGAHSGVAFNGQLPESCTGHYLLGHGHRAYSPGLRRFLSPDGLSPFGKGGANAYAYCQGDPVNSTDPTGSISRPLLVLGAVAGLGVSIALWQGGIELSKKYGQKVIQNADGSYRTDNTMDVVAGALIMLGFVMLIGTVVGVGVGVGLKRAKISSNVAAGASASVRPPTPPTPPGTLDSYLPNPNAQNRGRTMEFFGRLIRSLVSPASDIRRS